MKNEYRTDGEFVYIKLLRKDGNHLETCIDKADLPLVDLHPGSWHAHWLRTSHSFYCHTNTYPSPGTQKTVSLHCFLLSPPKGTQVDHINHDTLDNTRSNLRIVDRRANCLNKETSCGASGLRGAYWSKRNQNWQSAMTVNGKHIHIGTFDTAEEAHQAYLMAFARAGTGVVYKEF